MACILLTSELFSWVLVAANFDTSPVVLRLLVRDSAVWVWVLVAGTLAVRLGVGWWGGTWR